MIALGIIMIALFERAGPQAKGKTDYHCRLLVHRVEYSTIPIHTYLDRVLTVLVLHEWVNLYLLVLVIGIW